MPNTKQLQSNFKKGLADWVEIFRAGKQTDSRGRVRQFTQEDLDAVIANHDPEHPPRHVITHKEMYSPFSYGDASELMRDGDSLYAKSSNIEPQFERLVKAGRLPERSIRLQPVDNGWKLEHIAWLGAEPPAVDGLAPVSFSAADDSYDFAMDTHTPGILAGMMRNMRDFLIEQFGKEKADEVMPDWEINSLNRYIADLESDDPDEHLFKRFSQNPIGDGTMPDFTQADIDAAKKQAADDARKQAEADFSAQQTNLQQQLDAERSERQRSDLTALIQSHIKRGVAPADLVGAADFMMLLDNGDEGAFEFSQGTGDKAQTIKTSQLDFVKGLLDKLPVAVDTATHEFDDDPTVHSDFNAPQGSHIDADSLALHNKALDYQRTHQNVEYLDAVQIITRQEQR